MSLHIAAECALDHPQPQRQSGISIKVELSLEAVGSASTSAPGHGPAPASSNIDRTELKERAGTRYFMSCEILKGYPGLIHRVYHDLESYYWVIIWIVLRFTRHNLGQAMSERVFEYSDIDEALQKKTWWLFLQGKFFGDPLVIEGNAPLTELMSNFKSLVGKMVNTHYKDCPLTYEAVLKVFDDALAQTGWPEDDRVRCTLLDPRSKQDSAEGHRKPIRMMAVSDSSVLKERSSTNAELDVPQSIPKESTGAEAGPSTVPEDRRSSKRLRSESHAEAMGPPPSPRSLLGELPLVEPAAAVVPKGSRKKSRRSHQS